MAQNRLEADRLRPSRRGGSSPSPRSSGGSAVERRVDVDPDAEDERRLALSFVELGEDPADLLPDRSTSFGHLIAVATRAVESSASLARAPPGARSARGGACRPSGGGAGEVEPARGRDPRAPEPPAATRLASRDDERALGRALDERARGRDRSSRTSSSWSSRRFPEERRTRARPARRPPGRGGSSRRGSRGRASARSSRAIAPATSPSRSGPARPRARSRRPSRATGSRIAACPRRARARPPRASVG